MRLFVTGGSGFIGRSVVSVASCRGHDVVRLTRRTEPETDSRVRAALGDIRYPEPWLASLVGADAVIHLAAAVGGDFHTQFSATVLGTESLLDAMAAAGVRRLVHVSSFSVYDYRAMAVGSRLDEKSPLEARPLDRDAYTQTKLAQERLVREFTQTGAEVTVVRPGAVYGPDHLWNAGLAIVLRGDLGVAYAPLARQKLTYVDNCAEAIVLAAERSEAIGATINVVDDDLPTQRRWARAMRTAGLDVPRAVPVPYRVASAAAEVLAFANRRLVGGRAKFPGVLVPATLDAQYRPLRYPNDVAKSVLGWQPRWTLDEALLRVVKERR